MNMPDSVHNDGEFYRLYFDKLPISLWHFDMSAIRRDFGAMAAAKAESPEKPTDPEGVRAMMAKVRVLEVNAATLELYEAPDSAALQAGFGSIIPEEVFPALMQGTKALFGPRGSFTIETWNRTLRGKRLEVRLHLFSEGSAEGAEPDHVLMAVDDLNPRQRREAQAPVHPARGQS
jgi:PAS domain-containing protein